MILANWCNFSDRQSNMYNKVPRYGSFIIVAMVKFEQPVFVYIILFSELCNGPWVVIDQIIDPTAININTDMDACGGVLEPERHYWHQVQV